jgi:hypothetical protein
VLSGRQYFRILRTGSPQTTKASLEWCLDCPPAFHSFLETPIIKITVLKISNFLNFIKFFFLCLLLNLKLL